MPKALALLSGGLDSTLAILLMRRQGIEVTAVTFMTHFGCEAGDTSSCSRDSSSNAARYGFEVKLCHLADKFIDIVKNPKHGHGKNMNPCLDCRILMLREAGEFMRMCGADFIVTGEVIGQRPMSQRRDTFPVIDRESGLAGHVLRPLSAKLMKPTIAEDKGLVNREMLCGFSGRSRKPQMALAAEFGLTDYPAPAGGCLLTDPNYSHRLREMLSFTPDPTFKDLNLLRVGRHFRLPSGTRIIVGRNEAENTKIEALAGADDHLVDIVDYGSPLAFVGPEAAPEEVIFAAGVIARYSKGRHLPEVDATVTRGGVKKTIRVAPGNDDVIEVLKIQLPEGVSTSR